MATEDGLWLLGKDGVCVDAGVRDASSEGNCGVSVRLGEDGEAEEGVFVSPMSGIGVAGAPALGVLSRAGLLAGVCAAPEPGVLEEGV